MTKPYHIFRDNTGRLLVTAAPTGSTVVADFLVTDIRENADHCDTVLEMLKRRLAGEHADQDCCVGNAYRLSIEHDGAHLENIHDEQAPSARIPGSELLNLLQEWRSHF